MQWCPSPSLRPATWSCAAALVVLCGCATAPPPAQQATEQAPQATEPAPQATGPAPPAALPQQTPPPQASADTAPAATAPAEPAAAAPAPADAVALEQRFAEWIASFRAAMRSNGIDEATLQAAFDGVQYLPRVVDLDRAQPEFTRPVWDYLDATVSPQRVALGQQKLAELRTPIVDAAARYGVTPGVLVAIWGIESNFGGNYGSTPTIDALATLAFDGRREGWARGQLHDALKILQSGDIARAQMIGSWAGAMGQTQFLPSAFLAHAVDGDGDGRRDLWGSMADVMSSTANFLSHAGWRAGEPWGLEVVLPPDFDVARADPQTRQTSAQWAAEGVHAIDGAALPEIAEAAILLPAGARGPAFLVGHNFRTLLRYNNSVNYALAVSLLSQRIAGGPPVLAAWPRELPALSRSQIRELQTALNARGFDSGIADGAAGPATRDALRRFQRSIGVPADGYPTLELLLRLQAP
ncbi:MAG: lytic murein transglycosylase [Burkholderiaceae bacterium]|nr:lytic murein transglycosylase [Burkholderiaceae bacterium]